MVQPVSCLCYSYIVMENQNNNSEPSQQLGYASSKVILGDLDATVQDTHNTEISPSSIVQPMKNSAPDDLFVGMTSKDIVHEKPKRLIGVYIFAGLCFLQIPGFLFSNDNQLVSIVGIIFVSIMGVGILTRKEPARKIVVVLAVLSIIFMLFGLFSFISSINKIDQSRPIVNQEFNKIQADPSSSAEKKQRIQDLQIALETDWNNMHKNVLPKIYITSGVIIFLQASTVLYFMLPKVRQEFRNNG